MQVELKPCPFCGGEAKYGLTMAGEEVYCTSCHAAMPRTTTKAKAIAAWNSRAERTCKEVLIKYWPGCSECRHAWEITPNYCPNCGAKVVDK